MGIAVNLVKLEHIGAAIIVGVGTALGEWLTTGTINAELILGAATVAYGASYTFQSYKSAAAAGDAAFLKALASLGSPATTPAPTVTTVQSPDTDSTSTSVVVPALKPALPTAITYSLDGQQITVTVNSPIGTTETVNGVNYVVGSQLAGPLKLPNGDTVPAGAYYIGAQEFEKGGSYFS